MTKQEALATVNNQIDKLIIAGKTKTAQYKRLIRLHKQLAK